MTTGVFKYIDPTSCVDSEEPFIKPWTKVDDSGRSFNFVSVEKRVENIRGKEREFSTDTAGFSVHNYPSKEKQFTDEDAVRNGYYAEVEQALKDTLVGVKKVEIFDHTIRRKDTGSPRQPVQQVHVDQTTAAAIARVRRHLPPNEAEELLKGRFQIVNLWRPIGHPASDSPLAVIDWRTTKPEDFVKVDLLYPMRDNGDDGDDRGKERYVAPSEAKSVEGYEVKGETMGVAPNEEHKFYYWKDMTPDEMILLKCFDSTHDGAPRIGVKGRAKGTPHTSFINPETPRDAPGRQSIEVRALVFYE